MFAFVFGVPDLIGDGIEELFCLLITGEGILVLLFEEEAESEGDFCSVCLGFRWVT